MKKNTLLISYDISGLLFGIVSTAPDFKLAWLINKVFSTHFIKENDHTINFNNNQILTISHFLHSTENTTLRLIKNKSLSGNNLYIIPEQKNFDYFLLIDDETESWENDFIKSKFKQIKEVQFIQLLDIEKLKSKENLIFE